MNNEEKFSETSDSETFLADQFDSPGELMLNGEKIRVVDIAPSKLKSEIPTLVVPGFSATPEALKDSILRTAEAGRRVISAYASHGIDVAEKKSDLPEAKMRKLEMILELIKEKGLSRVNVIANSGSSIYVAVAALLYPDKFANIVFVEPAGLIGEDSFFKLFKRTLEDAKLQAKNDANMVKVKYPSPNDVGVKSILSAPVASVKEVMAISHSDITEALTQIHKSGVGVSIIHAVDDKIFPMEKVQKMTKANMVDGFYSVKGTHNSIYLYEPYGRVAETALTALENKTKKT